MLEIGKRITPLKVRHVTPILPLIYDESLSYYECICKFTAKLNEVIKQINENTQAVNDVIQLVTEVKTEWDEYKVKIDAFLTDAEERIKKVENDWNTYKTHFDMIISEWEQYKQTIEGLIQAFRDIIVQETGQQTDKVMSQKAVTDELNKKQNIGDYATRTELSEGLNGKQNKGNYATKTELSDGLAGKQDVGDYITQTEADSTYATKAEVTSGLAGKQDKGDYTTKTELSEGLAGKQDVGDYVTNSELNEKLAEKQDVGNYITSEQLTQGLNMKVDKSSVVQTTGASESSIMSQKAVTDELNKKISNIYTYMIDCSTSDGDYDFQHGLITYDLKNKNLPDLPCIMACLRITEPSGTFGYVTMPIISSEYNSFGGSGSIITMNSNLSFIEGIVANKTLSISLFNRPEGYEAEFNQISAQLTFIYLRSEER